MSQVSEMHQIVRQSLSNSKYKVYEETTPETDMSFDMIARYKSSSEYTPALLIKILLNIDSIRPHIFNEMKLISHLISGIPLLIGQENRHSPLRENSIYIRKDILTVNVKTFKKIIEHPHSPLALSIAKRGGFFHEVDSEKLLKLREKKGLSRNALAEKVGVSSKSIEIGRAHV